MNVAVIGFGGWGSIHAQALSHLTDHSLKAIACRSEETGAKVREAYPDVAVFTDYRKVLAMPEIEAVHVVVPSYLHVEIAMAALAAGKHVVLEKPMATTLADADRLVDAAGKSDRVVTVVHELRVSEQWSTIRKVIKEGRIGTPRYALLNLFRFPYRAGAENWRYSPDRVGSWVLEEPIHFIDLLLWYFQELGTPTDVTAFVNRDQTELSRDFTAVFRFPGGAHGVISQTLSAFEHHQVVEVTGSDGAVRSLWSGAMDRTDKPEFSVTIGPTGMNPPEQVPFAAASGELFEIELYLDKALKGFSQGESLYTVTEERELIRLCLAAEESARTGRTVDLEIFGRHP